VSSIFLSHNHKDKPFVHKLASTLKLFGVKSWVDEYEMLPGDSLIGKIQSGIESSDFLGAVLSVNSVKSEWVTRELHAALNDEIANRRVKVIPLLVEECALPPFLRDKVFADFRTNFYKGLADVLRTVAGDTIDPRNFQEDVTNWSKKNSFADPRAAFFKFVREQVELRKRKAVEQRVRIFIASSPFDDVLRSVREDKCGEFVNALIDIFEMSARCDGYNCGEPLRTMGTMAEIYGHTRAHELFTAIYQSGHDNIDWDHYATVHRDEDRKLCLHCSYVDHHSLD
jgi:hypothetical protein